MDILMGRSRLYPILSAKLKSHYKPRRGSHHDERKRADGYSAQEQQESGNETLLDQLNHEEKVLRARRDNPDLRLAD